ncbi:uncharacterized protein LOC112573647 [Pomacea canaliculata]|uniref:uncharacterized protein LOC112573647 n=1 Tax=Pomacea canaliculata TaxID=400727 RepID=UPI000D73B5C1|nr:uncharacterized protein LOC112573647 [Pomacea canaliculata]
MYFAGGCVSCTAAIETASEGSDLSALETALMLAERSQLAYFLKRTTWYKQAKERHKKLRRLSLVTKTEKLHPKHVREIRRYTRPHAAVRDTLVATYILLGEPPDQLKWREVRALLSMPGSDSIMERIKNNHLEDLDEERVQRAAALLGNFRWEEVRAVSIAAGAFYQWSKEVVENFQNSQATPADPTLKEEEPKEENVA